MAPQSKHEWTHTWYFRRTLPERKGKPCRIVAKGGRKVMWNGNIVVEFPDRLRVVTSRHAVRRRQK